MYFITTKRMLEVCFSVHPNIQYRTGIYYFREARTAELFLSLRIVNHDTGY